MRRNSEWPLLALPSVACSRLHDERSSAGYCGNLLLTFHLALPVHNKLHHYLVPLCPSRAVQTFPLISRQQLMEEGKGWFMVTSDKWMQATVRKKQTAPLRVIKIWSARPRSLPAELHCSIIMNCGSDLASQLRNRELNFQSQLMLFQ